MRGVCFIRAPPNAWPITSIPESRVVLAGEPSAEYSLWVAGGGSSSGGGEVDALDTQQLQQARLLLEKCRLNLSFASA